LTFLVVFNKQGNQWAQTSTYPKIFTISWTYSNNCRSFHDSLDSIRLITLSNFSLLLSVAVRGRPLRGRSVTSMFLSLKCLSHCLIVHTRLHVYITAIREYIVGEFPF
jgi:hypothetical protein